MILLEKAAWRVFWAIPGSGLLLFFPAHLFCQKNLPDSVVLRQVVIQATRAGANHPVPHTNLSAAEIAKIHQAQDVPFLLGSVPSLVENSDAGAGVGYTGLRIRGSDPTRVNVTINGVPLNDAESQGLFWVDLPDLAASAAEIQVQRGVGSSTNGAGAFGATINLDLSRVEAEPFAVLTNSAGSFATRKHSAYVGTGLLDGKMAFTGRLSQIISDGYIDRASANLQSFHLTGAYVDDRQSVQAHLLSGHEITYQAWNGVPAQYVDDPERRTFNTAGTEQPGAPYDDEVDDYTQRHFLLHYKRHFARGLSLQLNGHYTCGFGFYEQYRAKEILADYNLPALSIGDTTWTTSDLVRRRWLDNHFYGTTFALRWAPPVNPPLLTGPPVFLLGGAWSRYEGRHFGEVIWAQASGAPKDFRYYDNDADKRDANIFLKMELNFNRGPGAFLDLQYRTVGYEFLGFDQNLNNVGQSVRLHFFNPKIGMNYSFGQHWTAHAFFGVGRREPNRDDYTQSTPDSRPRAERLRDWEAGLKKSGTNWSTSLNVYWMDYRDQLAPDGRLNDVGAYIRTNVARSYRAGVEWEAAARLYERWQLGASAALSRNKIRSFTEYRDNWDTGQQEAIEHRNTDLAFSPALVARGEAGFDFFPENPRHALTVTFTGKHVGRQFLDNTSNANTTLPAYFFADLRLNYDLKKWIGEQIGFIVAVHNLFNARYSSNGWTYRYVSAFDNRPFDPYSRLESGNVYNQTGFFPQAGRHFMATVRISF